MCAVRFTGFFFFFLSLVQTQNSYHDIIQHPSNEISCLFDFVIKMCAQRYLLCEHFACSYLSSAFKKENYRQSKGPIITDFYTPTNYIVPWHLFHITLALKHLLYFAC